MAVNLEDAGFKIRDIVAWVYGSGFPKSLNIGKAVDKLQGNQRDVVRVSNSEKDFRNLGIKTKEIHGLDKLGVAVSCERKQLEITKGSSEWEGWGTALKPAMELWTLCRKPLSEKTIAQNVLKHETGGINIDGSRVTTGDAIPETSNQNIKNNAYKSDNSSRDRDSFCHPSKLGRFPANLIHDGSGEVLELMGESQRFFYCAKASKSERNRGLEGFEKKQTTCGGGLVGEIKDNGTLDTASAGGKYGSVKAYQQNFHPTVKPISLMRYLCRLITPPNGIVLDPFIGSGSTGVGAKLEGFNFIGIEKEKDYCKIAEARIKPATEQLRLF